MTKEELREIIDFLNTIVKTFDELSNRITYYAAFLLGKEVSRSQDSDKAEESTMKYKHTQIKRRTDGRWYARYKLANGKYYDIYGRTQAECYEKLKAFANNKKLLSDKIKALSSPPVKKTTFGEFFETWYNNEKVPNCKSGTLRGIKSKYKNYLYKLSDFPIAEIKADDVRAFLLDIKQPSVRAKCQSILGDVFNKAVFYDLVPSSVMQKVSKYKYQGTPREPLTIEEEKAFIKEAEKYDCALIFFLMLYEGLRTSEAKAITPADIKDTYIIVSKSIDDFGNFTTTKTSNTRRVPIFEPFKPYADSYRGTSTSPCLRKVNKHTAVKEYNEIQKKIGLTKSMYSLRHTFATRCEEAGISIKQTALWLGHSDIETTSKHYVGILSDFEQQNVIKKDLHQS